MRRASDNQSLQERQYDAFERGLQTIEYVDPATGAAHAAPVMTWHVMLGAETLQEYRTTPPWGQDTPVLLREFTWGDRLPEPVAMVDHTAAGAMPAGTAEVFTYLHDALGSVVALADSNGAVVEQYVYDPYGTTYIEDPAGAPRPASAYGNPWMWTGQRYDAAARLYHFTFRTYSPSLGRWLQRDPLGYVDGLNLYEYVHSFALGAIDPAGLQDSPMIEQRYRRWHKMHLEGRSAEVRQEERQVLLGGALGVCGVGLEVAGIAAWGYIALNPEVVPVVGTLGYEILLGEASPNQALVGGVDDLVRGAESACAQACKRLAGEGAEHADDMARAGAGVVDDVADATDNVLDDLFRVLDETAAANPPRCAVVHGHHSYPTALGGSPKQTLAELIQSMHTGIGGIHSDLAQFEGGWLYPRRGRTGAQIIAAHGSEAIEAGLRARSKITCSISWN